MKQNNDLISTIQEYVMTGRNRQLCFDRIYHCVDSRNLWRYLNEVSKLGFNSNNPRLAEVHEEMFERAYQ